MTGWFGVTARRVSVAFGRVTGVLRLATCGLDPFLAKEIDMRRLQVVTVGLLVAYSGALAVAEDLKSGLQPGDPAGAFNVKDVTGPNQGKSLCYR